MGRVLVTGGAGFIGSHLTGALLARGHEVWAIDNFDDYYAPALKRANVAALAAHPGFRLLEGDLCDRPWLHGALGGVAFDLVYHLAARAGIPGSCRDPIGYAQMNVTATLALLEELRAGPTRRIAFASSSSVYGRTSAVPFHEDDPAVRPISPYSALKRAVELLLHTYHHLYGFRVLALRFFTVFGPRQRPEMAISMFTRAIDQGREIVLYGDGSSERDYTYVDDIVEGALGALDADCGYEIVNLGGSERTRLIDLIRLIERCTGKPARLAFRPARAEELPATCADIAKARRLLGYAPRVPVAEGIARYHAWYLDHRDRFDGP